MADIIDLDQKRMSNEEVVKYVQDAMNMNNNNDDIVALRNSKEDTPEEGQMTNVYVAIDPVTGENRIVGEVDQEIEEEKSLSDIGSSISDEPVKITEDIINKCFENNESFVGKIHNISDESIKEFLKIIEKYNKTKEDVKYKDLPKEFQDIITKFAIQSGHSVNEIGFYNIRNEIAQMFIDETITNIGIDDIVASYYREVENIYKATDDHISTIIKDYADKRSKIIEDAAKNITDPEKKKVAENIIDSIHDAYALERLIECAKEHKIKIKNYDLERPEKVYRDFLYKYQNSPSNIYSINVVASVLRRHLNSDDPKDTDRFLILFCKFCRDYNPEDIAQHSFMYYVTYNIVLLDAYKNKEYDEFAPDFLDNIRKVISYYK